MDDVEISYSLIVFKSSASWTNVSNGSKYYLYNIIRKENFKILANRDEE